MIISEREESQYRLSRYLLFQLKTAERQRFRASLGEIRPRATQEVRGAHIQGISEHLEDWPALNFARRFPDASAVLDSFPGETSSLVSLRLFANPSHAETQDFATTPLFQLTVPKGDSYLWHPTLAGSPRMTCLFGEMRYPSEDGQTGTFHFPEGERPAHSGDLKAFSRLLGSALAQHQPRG